MTKQVVEQRIRWARRLTFVLAACLTAAAVAYTAWSYALQMRNMTDRALTEARTLCIEVMASWDYVDAVQHSINYNSDGTYDFKGVYCSVAGKNIARRFTSLADGYRIGFVRENPRTPTDEPDELESQALACFASGDAQEYYEVLGGVEGRGNARELRYVAPLEVTGGCLTCHGEPAGTRDEVGFMREGMQLGDLAGAVSIAIPLDSYMNDALGYVVQTVAFFLVLVTAVTLLIRRLLKRWALEPLSTQNAQLQAVSQAKGELVSIISHELRTPLASIIAFTDLWAKTDGCDREQERELVGEVRRNGEVLLEMVNNTVDVARIEAGRYVLACEEVDVDEVMGAVLSMMRPLAIEKGLQLECRVDAEVPVVMSDWESLRKILVNLVSNAVKYTDEGRVEARVSYDTVAGELVMVVRDTGIGIRKEDLEGIFEVFSQAEGMEKGRRRNGSGLGLSLVRNLARLMGGEVEVQSTPGTGSTFTVHVKARACDMDEGDEKEL